MEIKFKGFIRRVISGKRKIDGRSHGQISIRHRGGALKRKYRFIEFFRQKWLNKWICVLRLEYDPNRNAFIALCSLIKEGIYMYLLAVDKLTVGELLLTSNNLITNLNGSTTQLKSLPDGILLNNLELYRNSGSKVSRAAGTSSMLIKQYNYKYSLIKLSSKEFRLISSKCYGTIGIMSNIQKNLQKLGKASVSRFKGHRPHVRGVVMNPVDHPHGGRTKGGMHWRTFSGKLTSQVSTRKKKRYSSRFIIIGHRKQRLMKKNG